MSLADLIRPKSAPVEVATATPATPATLGRAKAGTVASVATVTVANPEGEKPRGLPCVPAPPGAGVSAYRTGPSSTLPTPHPQRWPRSAAGTPSRWRFSPSPRARHERTPGPIRRPPPAGGQPRPCRRGRVYRLPNPGGCLRRATHRGGLSMRRIKPTCKAKTRRGTPCGCKPEPGEEALPPAWRIVQWTQDPSGQSAVAREPATGIGSHQRLSGDMKN